MLAFNFPLNAFVEMSMANMGVLQLVTVIWPVQETPARYVVGFGETVCTSLVSYIL